MKKYFPILIPIFLISYFFNKKEHVADSISFNTQKHGFHTLIPIFENNHYKPAGSLFLVDYFVDSTNVGRKGKNKLEVALYRSKDSTLLKLNFYTRVNKNWVTKNYFELEKDQLSGIDSNLSDYNNDSFLDFDYKALIAARGANYVRQLFIYDKKGDSLIFIKNATDYPNIAYNKKLDCIDAYLVHGTSSQAFLHIKKDSLVTFAWIHIGARTIVTEIDENGVEKEILNDTITNTNHEKFIDYNPLQLKKVSKE